MLFMLLMVGFQLARASVFPQHLGLLAGCQIYDAQMKLVRALPGEQCLLRPDGSFVSATGTGLKFYDANGVVKWSLDSNFHHQIVWSANGEQILALASEVRERVPGEKVRWDRFQVIGLDGVVAKEGLAFEMLRQSGQAPFHDVNRQAPLDVGFEATHVNSIYEIPPLRAQPQRPRHWAPGNYVVDAFGHGLYVFDAELKRVLWHQRSPHAHEHFTHDPQVLPNGRMLQFLNLAQGSQENLRSSAVEEVDLASGKQVLRIGARPRAFFSSRFGGSVQNVDDDLILFTTSFTGIYLYSRRHRDVVWTTDVAHVGGGGAPRYVQKAVALDTRLFLKHQHSP